MERAYSQWVMETGRGSEKRRDFTAVVRAEIAALRQCLATSRAGAGAGGEVPLSPFYVCPELLLIGGASEYVEKRRLKNAQVRSARQRSALQSY